MFGLTRKAAPKQTRIIDQPWIDQTITRQERLRTHYSRNPEAEEYIQHAVGVSHNCAALNATVCTHAVLRLYKRAGARDTNRQGRVFGKAGHKAIAMKAGRYGQKLADFTNGGAEMVEVVDHPILDLISKPNPMYPGESMTWLRWYYDWICGNAYDKVLFQGTTPVQMSPLFAQYVRVTVSEQGEIGYYYGRSNEQWGEYTADEVIHYKLRPSLFTPLYGMGAMHGILPYVDLITDTLIHDLSLAKNGMRPDFMMSVPEMTTDEQVEKFEKRFASKFRGAGNWYKGLFVKGDAKLTPLTFSEKDILSLPKQEKAEKIIREAFGHNESMNDPGGQTYNGALVGYSDQFLGGTIEPALQHDAAQKNERLLPMFGLDPDVYSFGYDPLVTKDEKAEAEVLRLDFTNGLITANEYRVERGLEKFKDEMADKLLFNGQPLGKSPQAADPFAGLFGGGGGGSAPKPEQVEEPTGAPALPPAPEDEETVDSEPEPSKSIKSIVLELEAPQWRDCDGCRQTKADEVAADPRLREALEKYQGSVQSLAFDTVKEMQDEALADFYAGRVPNLQPMADQAAAEFEAVMKPIVDFGVQNILTNRGNVLGATTVPDEAFNIAPTRALEALRSYTIELANDLKGTTADMAKRAVEVGLEQGLSIDKIADQIEGVPEYRAEAIARTETQRAVQTGTFEAAKAVGAKEKRILTAPGVRKSHAAIAAKGFIDIDEPFAKSGETLGGETFAKDVMIPPLGVNCRCSMSIKFPGEDD